MSSQNVALSTFINAGKANIFTTKGRCMPGNSIKLDQKEAATYKDLVNEKDYKEDK